MPSESPSLSHSPSLDPSGKPSGQPSIAPTPAPTGTPSVAPSGAPSMTPSVEPTNVPTQTPSATPSASPTEEAFKTKFSNTDVILMDIEREMSDTHLAQFEITTLEFIRNTAPHTDGYEIDVLAVTILSQTAVYPDAQNQTTNDQGERRMQTKAALEVTFKAVGVVTEGSAPADFNFKNDIISPGFENHMDEYLYSLSIADVFFEPLRAYTSMKDVVEPEGKGKFVAAVVFSVIAFLVAVFAAVYAVRWHLDSKRRRRNRRARLSGGQKSQTYSEDSAESTDDSDEENGVRPPLQLELFSPGKTDLQNVPITPRSIASPFKQDYRDNEASPLSPGTAKNAEPPSVLEETGAVIRKWLTPTMYSPQETNRPPRPSRSPDPMALKASTTDKPGTLTKGNVKEGVSVETTFVRPLENVKIS
jgi:heme exporter protein D